MKKLDTIILSLGAAALVLGLALMFASETPNKWGIGCLVLAGVCLYYILSAVDLCRGKAAEDAEKTKNP